MRTPWLLTWTAAPRPVSRALVLLWSLFLHSLPPYQPLSPSLFLSRSNLCVSLSISPSYPVISVIRSSPLSISGSGCTVDESVRGRRRKCGRIVHSVRRELMTRYVLLGRTRQVLKRKTPCISRLGRKIVATPSPSCSNFGCSIWKLPNTEKLPTIGAV